MTSLLITGAEYHHLPASIRHYLLLTKEEKEQRAKEREEIRIITEKNNRRFEAKLRKRKHKLPPTVEKRLKQMKINNSTK